MNKKNLSYLDKVLAFFINFSFILMILVVCLQIVARYALPWSPNWTEELARFCFIYMVSLGAGLAVKDNGYVSVNTLLDRLGLRAKQWMEMTILAFVILLMMTQFIFSIPLIKIVSIQISPSLNLNMSFMYASMGFMGLFVSIYSSLQLYKKYKNR